MSGGTLRSSAFTRGKEVLSHAITDYKGQIQNVKAARVYIFGESDTTEEDETDQTEFEMPEIRSRRGQQNIGARLEQVEEERLFFEKEIAEGETLQSFSIKYACPVAELKRINNLINDRDFFALRHLKIPMRRHGYLSSIIAQEEHNKKRPAGTHNTENGVLSFESNTQMDMCASDVDFSDPEMQKLVIRTVSIRENFSQQGQEGRHFLNKMDEDLVKYRQSAGTCHDSLQEVISVLTHTSIYPLERRKTIDGANCGLTLGKILIAALIVAVVVPIIFLYFKFFHNRNKES